jgi:hypothetical protein
MSKFELGRLKIDGLFCAQQLGKMSLPFGDRTAREKKRGADYPGWSDTYDGD